MVDSTGGSTSPRSLAELRARHVALLPVWRSEAPDRMARADAFRREAAAMGLWLDADADRDVAESLLDYWTAVLGGVPEAERQPLRFNDFDKTAVERKAAGVDAFLDSLDPAQAGEAKELFLRLLKLGPDGAVSLAPPIPRAMLQTDGAPSGALDALIDRLVAMGLLVVTPAETREEERIAVSFASIARASKRIGDGLAKRRATHTAAERLRRSALTWKANEEKAGYLLRGDAVKDADEHQGHNDVLDAFIAASRDAEAREREAEAKRREADIVHARERRRQLTAVAAVLALVVVGLGLVVSWLSLGAGRTAGMTAERSAVLAIERDARADVAQVLATDADPKEIAASVRDVEAPKIVRDAPGRLGVIWIGSASRPLLLELGTLNPVEPAAIKEQETYIARTNIALRSDYPLRDTYQTTQPVGTAPAGSLVRISATAKPYPRKSGEQYFATVLVIPRAYLQYARMEPAGAARVAEALRSDGFDVPGTERRDDYAGPTEIRFYHQGDRDIARALAASASGALQTAMGKAVPIRCVKFDAGDVRAVPRSTIVELWINPVYVEPPSVSDSRPDRVC